MPVTMTYGGQSSNARVEFLSEPTREADLLSEHRGVQVRDITRVPSERALGVQREGDGHRDIDGARVVQQEGDLGAGASLAAGHHHALRRGRLVQAMLYRFILRHTEVQLVEAQQEGVPVLPQESNWFHVTQRNTFIADSTANTWDCCQLRCWTDMKMKTKTLLYQKKTKNKTCGCDSPLSTLETWSPLSWRNNRWSGRRWPQHWRWSWK